MRQDYELCESVEIWFYRTHTIIHSMIQMVKNKLKHEKWMSARDLVEANVWMFERMGEALENNYQLSYTVDLSWQAAELYLKGLEE